jgi:hypothetical protein
MGLSIRAADDRHQFLYLPTLLGLVPRGNRVLDAMAYMVPKYLLFKTPQCGTNRGDLRYDVNAVAILVDHAREAADLALNPAQTLRARCLDVFPHVR